MSYSSPRRRLTPTDPHTLIHWSLDESAVPFASTGQNTTLTLVKGYNPSNIVENRTGVFGQACEFTPGTSATSGDTAVTPPGDTLTISCWVYCRSFPSPSIFIGKTYHLTGTGWNSPFWSIAISPDTSGIFVLQYNIAGTLTEQDGPATQPISLNSWCFLAVTYDGVLFRQYLNGNLIQTTNSPINSPIDWGEGGPWCVGGNNLQQTGGHDGFIDDIRIEDIVRSPEYLERQYKDGLGYFENTDTSSFTPKDVGGLVLWLRSDAGTTVISDKVSKVRDQSLYGSDALQATSGSRPLYSKYFGVNGHPHLTFDTNQEWMTGTANSLTDLTFFLVTKFGDTADRTPIELTDNSLVGPTGLHLINQSSPANTLLIQRHASGGNQETSVPSSSTDIKIYSATDSATSLNGFVDGAAQGTPAGPTTGLAVITNYVLGAADNTGTSEMVGDFYEYLLYNRVLSSPEMAAITGYLKKKYGYPSNPFSPTDIPGLIAWYDSEHTTLVTGAVDVLLDMSGNAHDGTAPSAGQRPVVLAADPQYGGHDSLGWSSENSTAIISPTVTYGTFTMVLVAKIQSSLSYIWADGFSDYLFSGIGFTSYTPVRDGTDYSAYDASSATWAESEVPRIITQRFDGTNAGNIFRINKINQTFSNSHAFDPGTGTFSTTFSTLTYINGTSSSDATFAMILLYDNPLSDDDLSRLEDYLTVKYNLFNPSFIPSLTSWFRADLGMTLSGSDVVTWIDQSGAGIQPSLSPLIASPQYEASGINGLPDLTFVAASSQSLVGTNALLGTTGVTLFGIFRTTSAGVHCIWGMQYNAYHYAIFLNVNSVTAGQLWFYDGNADHVISPATYNDGAPHCFVSTYDSGSGDMKLYVDNGSTPVVTGTGSGTIQNTAGDLNAIGSSTGASANDRYFSGSIAEVGSYSAALASVNVAKLMSYLKTRAGIV
jgi:hypothetical protein